LWGGSTCLRSSTIPVDMRFESDAEDYLVRPAHPRYRPRRLQSALSRPAMLDTCSPAGDNGGGFAQAGGSTYSEMKRPHEPAAKLAVRPNRCGLRRSRCDADNFEPIGGRNTTFVHRNFEGRTVQ
jgi:hypothetical protein